MERAKRSLERKWKNIKARFQKKKSFLHLNTLIFSLIFDKENQQILLLLLMRLLQNEQIMFEMMILIIIKKKAKEGFFLI